MPLNIKTKETLIFEIVYTRKFLFHVQNSLTIFGWLFDFFIAYQYSWIILTAMSSLQ